MNDELRKITLSFRERYEHYTELYEINGSPLNVIMQKMDNEAKPAWKNKKYQITVIDYHPYHVVKFTLKTDENINSSMLCTVTVGDGGYRDYDYQSFDLVKEWEWDDYIHAKD